LARKFFDKKAHISQVYVGYIGGKFESQEKGVHHVQNSIISSDKIGPCVLSIVRDGCYPGPVGNGQPPVVRASGCDRRTAKRVLIPIFLPHAQERSFLREKYEIRLEGEKHVNRTKQSRRPPFQ
jgi:hypothetical protein